MIWFYHLPYMQSPLLVKTYALIWGGGAHFWPVQLSYAMLSLSKLWRQHTSVTLGWDRSKRKIKALPHYLCDLDGRDQGFTFFTFNFRCYLFVSYRVIPQVKRKKLMNSTLSFSSFFFPIHNNELCFLF
jgi:hypothetical protein